MIDFKFFPHLIRGEREVSKNGYVYAKLKPDTPKEIRDEYMEMVEENDKRIEEGKPIIMY